MIISDWTQAQWEALAAWLDQPSDKTETALEQRCGSLERALRMRAEVRGQACRVGHGLTELDIAVAGATPSAGDVIEIPGRRSLSAACPGITFSTVHPRTAALSTPGRATPPSRPGNLAPRPLPTPWVERRPARDEPRISSRATVVLVAVCAAFVPVLLAVDIARGSR